MLPRPSGSYSGAASLPLPLRLLQPLSHLLVIRRVQCPPLCRAVPAVVPDLHVDVAVDEELHGRVVRDIDMKNRDYRRSEEHTSELQSPDHLVCRLLLEKKKQSNPFIEISSSRAQHAPPP